jgi:hypothetical protein
MTFAGVLDRKRVPENGVYFLMSGLHYSQDMNNPSAGSPWALQQQCVCCGLADLSPTASRGVPNTDLVNGLSSNRIVELVQSHSSHGIIAQYDSVMSPLGYADGWPCLLVVPIDPAMGNIALKWAQSADDTTRWNAARILRHIQSPENIAALQQIAGSNENSSVAILSQALAVDQLHAWGKPSPSDSGTIAAWPAVRRLLLALIFGLVAAGAWPFIRRRSTNPFRYPFTTVLLITLLPLWVGSYFKGAGFIDGHVEAGIWKGYVVVVYREHAAIHRSEPFQFAGSQSLLSIRGYFNHDYEPGALLPGQFVDGFFDGEQACMPTWSLLCGIAIPIWVMIAIVLCCPMIPWIINALRRSIDSRRRGFSVSLSSDFDAGTRVER